MLQWQQEVAERVRASETHEGNRKGSRDDEPTIENARTGYRRICAHDCSRPRGHLVGGLDFMQPLTWSSGGLRASANATEKTELSRRRARRGRRSAQSS